MNEEAKKPHPTKRIKILEADVDEEIIPLVNWLNSLYGVITQHCCQGENSTIPDPNRPNHKHLPSNRPYVLFFCWEPESLLWIVERLGSKAEITIHTYNGYLRYKIHFFDKEQMIGACKWLLKEKP